MGKESCSTWSGPLTQNRFTMLITVYDETQIYVVFFIHCNLEMSLLERAFGKCSRFPHTDYIHAYTETENSTTKLLSYMSG